MSGRLQSRRTRLGLALIFAMAALGGVMAQHSARAQSPAQFAYVTFLPGWNLVSFADTDPSTANLFLQSIDSPLYAFRPGDTNYEVANPNDVKFGYGYWVHMTKRFSLAYDLSDNDSTRVDITAGTCVLVGNPSTRGSARVRGADRSYEFSTTLNQYVATSLIGIGRAAWICNDTYSGSVSVGYEGDHIDVTWPDCCDRGPTQNQGQGLVVFQNASDAPLILGLRQTDASGGLLSGGDGVSGAVQPSGTSGGCDAAPSFPFSMAPGTYTLHMTIEGTDVPDIVLDIDIQPGRKYQFCYHP